MHLRCVLEAIQADGDSNHLWVRSVIILRKPLHKVGIVEDLVGMGTFVGYTNVILASHKDVGSAYMRLQEVLKDVPVASRINLRVDDWYLLVHKSCIGMSLCRSVFEKNMTFQN